MNDRAKQIPEWLRKAQQRAWARGVVDGWNAARPTPHPAPLNDAPPGPLMLQTDAEGRTLESLL